MENTIVLLGVFFLFFANLNAQTPYYFYNYTGEKVYLSLNTEYVFLSLKEQKSPVGIEQNRIVLQSDKSDQKQYQMRKGTSRFWAELSFEEKLSDENYLQTLSDIKRKNKDAIVSPYFKINENDKIGLSNFFYVKIKEDNDTVLLRQMAGKTNSIIIEQDKFMPLWFVLSTTEASELNALECSNIFYESGLFLTAEPDLMAVSLQCADDTYFNQQWGLKNAGQYNGNSGIDIKTCDAWQISTGHDVIVAVVDEGIDLTHPDLVANIHPLSFDCQNRTSPSTLRGSHGTACAGIIGAVGNNSIGISGVAPNCQLMSISRFLGIGSPIQPLIRQDLATGINWSWQNGADVISNSWAHKALQGTFITDAINNAITQGRNGLGCVLVFCTQNEDDNGITYPATLSNVIAVGAVSPCGERKSPTSCDGEDWGSNYGDGLDIVAPGVLIPTTDIQGNGGYNTSTGVSGNYYANFNGTSAACPHVAGVAALILSVNPDLTQKQVRDIIEQTTQKVGDYTYADSAAYPNGPWHEEMGYGLVNANKAVQKAICTLPFGAFSKTINTDETINGSKLQIYNTTVKSSKKLTVNACDEVVLNPNFTVEPGAELEINVMP